MKQSDGDTATISGKGFSLRFDKKAGVMTEYRYQGVVLLERGPAPDFWRAPTNNDRGAWKSLPTPGSRQQGRQHRTLARCRPRWNVKDVHVEKVDDSTAKVTVNADLPVVGATYSMTYTVHGDRRRAGGLPLHAGHGAATA